MTEEQYRALHASDDDVRLQMILEVGTPTNAEDMQSLVELLADPNWRVRKAAVRVLAEADVTQIVPLLIEALNSGDKNIRTVRFQNSAIECLTIIGQPAIPGLIATLRDPAKDVRISAANALGAIQHHDACDALIAALNDEHVNVRYAAVEALSKIPSQKSVLPLTNILDGDEEWLKLPAISALGYIGDYRATPYLVNIAQHPLYLQTVIEALGFIGDERGIPCIIEALNSTDREIRKSAVLSMERMAQKLEHFHAIIEQPSTYRQAFREACTESVIQHLIEFTDLEDYELVSASIKLLGWSGRREAAVVLLEKLDKEQLLETVANALIQIGDDAVKPLAAAYDTSYSSEQQLLIIDCLREIGGAQVLELFVGYLQHSDDDMLTYALLKSLNEPSFLDLLLADRGRTPRQFFTVVADRAKQELKSPHPLVRSEAVFLWGHLFGLDVLDDIFTATKDSEPAVRMKAIQHLGYFARANDELTEHLIILLSDDHPNIRKQAAIALGNSESPVAFPALLLVLDDSNATVGRAAVRGLAAYLAHHHLPDYQNQVLEHMTDVLVNRCRRYQDGLLKIETCTTLQQIRTPESRELLLQLTQDTDFDVRNAAILALGAFTSSKDQLIPILLPFLDDDHWSVREASATTLGVLQAAEAETPLLHMLDDPDVAVRRAVFVALGRLCSFQAVPMLITHLTHEKLDYAAYQALSLIAVREHERLAPYVEQENPKVHVFLEHILQRIPD